MSYLNSNNPEENYSTYFPYFNHTLFIDQTEFSKEEFSRDDKMDSQLSDELSTSISQESVNSFEDEEKLIPPNLLDFSPVKNSLTCDINSNIIPKNLLNSFEKEEKHDNEKIKPELQKYILPKELFDTTKGKKKSDLEDIDEKKLKAKPFIPTKYKMNNTFLANYPANFFNSKVNYLNKYNSFIQYELSIKKTKKKFIERKGDWKCSKCNNINFAFRNQCNKCKISKEESEKILFELGGKILKFDEDFNNKKKNLLRIEKCAFI